MSLYVELEDVQAVEDTIKKLNYPTPNELWKALKGRFKTKNLLGGVIDYFLKENMIIIDKGRIVWIWNPEATKRIFSNRSLFLL